uniref:DDE Tnp4 domain-containing protein n=1 Tax=Glossina brevipalpis TaxID=37001 RepID=A0A1A9X322_9MUSC
MDYLEDEMFEEHLDEEYQNLDIEEGLNKLETKINNCEQSICKSNKVLRRKQELVLTLLKTHLHNFQFLVITKKRKAQQRWRRRQAMLRNLFIQILWEKQTNCLQTLPMIINPQILFRGVSSTKLERAEKPKENNRDYFDSILQTFTREQWLETLHISRNTFSMLCKRLNQNVSKAEVCYPVEKRVIISLYAFATGTSFHYIASLFNVPLIEIREILKWFVKTFLKQMGSSLLVMPNEDHEFLEIRTAFQQASYMPPVAVGVLSIFELSVDGKRIGAKVQGYDRVIVQVIIDDRLLFRKVEIAGNKPSLFLRNNCEVNYIRWPKIFGRPVSCFVAAPKDYPLRTWLMKSYDNPKKTYEFDFNEAMDNLYIFPDVALQRLFGRWKILSSSEFIESQLKGNIAKVCCALHNLLEEVEEFYDDNWLGNMDISKYSYTFRSQLTQYYDDCREALEMRDFLARCIGWSQKLDE